MNRSDRLIAIILLFQRNRFMRAQDIAAHFETSVRTIYRDLRALEEAGVPLSAEAGVGYSLVKGYHLPPVMFTHAEASALAIGEKFVENLTDLSLKNRIQSALLKIYAVMPRDKQHFLDMLQSRTEIISPVATTPLEEDNRIERLHVAIADNKVVKIAYFAQYNKQHTTRKIEPLGLIYYVNAWHLIAWCRLRGDYRNFRLERINALTVLDVEFRPHTDFSLPQYIRSARETHNAIEVKVKFPLELANTIKCRETYGFAGEEKCGDFTILTFFVDSSRWISRWLLSFGGDVEVLSPQDLKTILFKEGQKLVQRYAEKSH